MIAPPELRELFANAALHDRLDDIARGPRPPLPPGQISADEAAIAGHDGWLYIHVGSNQWQPQAEGGLQLTPQGVQGWGDLLAARGRWMSERGLRWVHLFVPEKQCVLPQHHPRGGALSAARPVPRIAALNAAPLLYPLAELRQAHSLAPVHYRSNSHWNAFGAYVTARALWRHLGIDEAPMAPVLTRRGLQHDLAVKFDGAVPDENFHELDVQPWLAFSNEAQVPGHVGRLKHLHHAAAPHPLRVLICGDSYAYDHGLAAWFAHQCRDVFCAWQFGVVRGLVEGLKPDIVVTQLAERFAIRLPVDVL